VGSSAGVPSESSCPVAMAGASEVPTVVMLGACGHGKSTLVEKATGLTGLSSAAATSYTVLSTTYRSTCGRLQVIDTPGSDALAESVEDRVKNNLHIASALSSFPVTLLLVVVKADKRIDRVVSQARGFSDNFIDFDQNLAVCVTHMDEVQGTWSKEQCSEHLRKQLDFDLVLYSQLDTPSDELIDEILRLCQRVDRPLNFTIDSDNFLQYFTIHDNQRRILRTVKDEVDMFRMAVQDFHHQLSELPAGDRPDAVFEFQAFMKEVIVDATRRVSERNGFDDDLLSQHTRINAIGHLACLRGQLRSVLVSVRRLALQYQSDAGVGDLRQCPHCGLVWAKVVGCPNTTCGNLPKAPDVRRDYMATFSFTISGGKLSMDRTGSRSVSVLGSDVQSQKAGVGCGRAIRWDEMKPVRAPAGFQEEVAPTAEDVALVATEHQRSWREFFAPLQGAVKRRLDYSPVPVAKWFAGRRRQHPASCALH